MKIFRAISLLVGLCWAATAYAGPIIMTSGLTAGGTSEDTILIDVDDAEAFLVRKNGDGGDVFVVDTSAASVGIGIAAGDGTLHVHTATAGTLEATASADDLVVENSGNGGISIMVPDANNAALRFSSPTAAEGGGLVYNHDGDSLKLYTKNAGADLIFATGSEAEAMRILDSGKISVGVAAGDGTFHVHTATAGSVSAGAWTDDLVVENSGSGGISILTPDANPGYITFSSPAAVEGASIKYSDATNILAFTTHDAASQITFASASESLAVTIGITGLVTFAQDVSVGDLAAVGSDPLCWDGSGASLIGDCSSLREWKSNIVDTEMGLAEVLQLRAREFDWDEQHGHGKHDVGFVAEEVEEVNPLLVTYRPELTGVKYNRLTALLVKAIQELEARVVELEQAAQ